MKCTHVSLLLTRYYPPLQSHDDDFWPIKSFKLTTSLVAAFSCQSEKWPCEDLKTSSKNYPCYFYPTPICIYSPGSIPCFVYLESTFIQPFPLDLFVHSRRRQSNRERERLIRDKGRVVCRIQILESRVTERHGKVFVFSQ